MLCIWENISQLVGIIGDRIGIRIILHVGKTVEAATRGPIVQVLDREVLVLEGILTSMDIQGILGGINKRKGFQAVKETVEHQEALVQLLMYTGTAGWNTTPQQKSVERASYAALKIILQGCANVENCHTGQKVNQTELDM